MPAPSAKLISKANAATIGFLKAELETGLGFARMAARIRSRKKPRPSDPEKIYRYLEYARQAYQVVSSHIGMANGTAKELLAINEKFAELQKMLEQT